MTTRSQLRRRLRPDQLVNETGASSVEYALLAAAVAGLVALAVFAFGSMVLNVTTDNCTTIRDTARPGDSCG